MPVFPSNPFRSARIFNSTNPSLPLAERVSILYRRKLGSHPFLLFGLPFISIMVLSSFLLTPATALRYERHDRTSGEVSPEDALKLGLSGQVDGGGDLGKAVADSGAGVSYNPRRRVVTSGPNSQRDEYYVRLLLWTAWMVSKLLRLHISPNSNKQSSEINGQRFG